MNDERDNGSGLEPVNRDDRDFRWVFGPIFIFMLVGAALALATAAMGPVVVGWQFAGMVLLAVVVGTLLIYLHSRIVRRRH